jgi:uncharacterized protein
MLVEHNLMRIKQFGLMFLLLNLTVTPVYADDLQDGLDAYDRKDYKTALEKLKPLAELGNASALFNLGRMYARGEGVKENNPEAKKLYRKSAENGDVRAQNYLGLINDIKKNYKEALRWYKKSANQGNADGQFNVGYKYFYGQGVPKDNVLAYMWFSLAGGNEGFASGYGTGGRKRAEMEMTSAQIAEAQKLAREWMGKHQKK